MEDAALQSDPNHNVEDVKDFVSLAENKIAKLEHGDNVDLSEADSMLNQFNKVRIHY